MLRANKLFLNPSQNDYADSIAAPYYTRPHYIPTVSAPLQSKEVNTKLDPSPFTIDNMLQRLQQKADLFGCLSGAANVAANNAQLKKWLG